MPATNSSTLCGGSADCAAQMASLTTQVRHWQIAGAVFFGVLVLAVFCIAIASILVQRRRAAARDTEKGISEPADTTRPFGAMVAEDGAGAGSADPGERVRFGSNESLTFVPVVAGGVAVSTYGVPAEWFQLADYQGEEIVLAKTQSTISAGGEGEQTPNEAVEESVRIPSVATPIPQ